MFSQESLITMANGTFKPINTLQRGDIVLNKLYKPTRILKVNIYENERCVRVQFDNGTNTFHLSPNTIVLCYYRLPDNTFKSEYCHISHVHENNGYMKSNLKLFSPDSDILIESYVESSENKTLYSLVTSDNSQSYLVNHAIISNNLSNY
jgi:hypothetical protein